MGRAARPGWGAGWVNNGCTTLGWAGLVWCLAPGIWLWLSVSACVGMRASGACM